MTSPNDYRPRLSVEITEEQSRALGRLIPWGAKNELFRVIIDDVIAILEEHGAIMIAAILTKQLKVNDLPSVKEALNANRKV